MLTSQLYNRLNNLSSHKRKLFNEMFNSYGEAIGRVLENRGLEQKWLVEEIIQKEKFNSLQQQLSRWIRSGSTVTEGYRNRINNALNIIVEQGPDGLWAVYSQAPDSVNEQGVSYAAEVEFPKDGKISRDHMKMFLGQIELIARTLKDSL